MFAGLKPRYELHHGVRISDRAVVPLFARRLISSRGSRRIQFKRFQDISSRNFPFPTTSRSIQVNPSHDNLLGNDQTSHRWLQLCSVTVTFQTVSFQTKLSTSWMKLLRRLGWPYGRCRRLLDSCMLLSSADITRWRWKSPQNLQNWNAWIGRFCSISTAILALSHWSFFSFFYLLVKCCWNRYMWGWKWSAWVWVKTRRGFWNSLKAFRKYHSHPLMSAAGTDIEQDSQSLARMDGINEELDRHGCAAIPSCTLIYTEVQCAQVLHLRLNCGRG